MKKLLLTVALVAGFTLSASNAHAISIPSGPTTFHWTNWETLVTQKGDQLSGIFRLDQILDQSNNVVWNDGQGGQQLTGTFSDLTVTSVTDNTPTGPGGLDSFNFSGGKLNIYLDSTPDFDPTNPSTANNDGVLWLSMDFVGGADLGNPATLVASTSTTGSDPKGNISVKGTGTALLDVTGGAAADIFDTNLFQRLDGSGEFADMALNNTFYILTDGTQDNWPVWSSDPIGANAVPEPASMILFGSGMLGFIARRKKRNA